MNKILKEIWPMIVGFIILFFIHTEIVITLVTIAVIIATFKIKYYKNEIYWFLIGVGIGILLELGGDYFYKLQTWTQGTFFGVPIWLPILWGYMFVIIRRVGNIVMRK